MALRLAELLAGLSRLADLGFGLQAGEAVRSSALAVRLARSLDLPDDDVRAALYTALLHHVGCTGYAHETARIFGDELALNVAARSWPATRRWRRDCPTHVWRSSRGSDTSPSTWCRRSPPSRSWRS